MSSSSRAKGGGRQQSQLDDDSTAAVGLSSHAVNSRLILSSSLASAFFSSVSSKVTVERVSCLRLRRVQQGRGAMTDTSPSRCEEERKGS